MNLVQMTAKLYEARDAMKFLFGTPNISGYQKMIAEHQGFIRRAMEQQKCGELSAALWLIKQLKEKHPDTGPIIELCLLAACVEMIEPN